MFHATEPLKVMCMCVTFLFQALGWQTWKHLWFSLQNLSSRDLPLQTWQFIFTVEPTTFWKWVWHPTWIFHSLGLCPMLALFPLKVDIRVENAEPLLRNLFGHQSHTSDGESAASSQKHMQPGRTRRKTDESHRAETEKCLSSTSNFLEQARAMVSSLLGQGSGEFGQWPFIMSLDYKLLGQCCYLP